jgi:hypothetical protein
MTDVDREVLEFIGRQGKREEQIEERFYGFDVLRLIRAGLVEITRTPFEETQNPKGPSSPAFEDSYVLTPRGAEAVGIDPTTLHAA